MNAIHPFRVEVPQADLDDLRDRLNRARWTPALPGADWSRGVPVDYLRELVAYWAGEFDWRQAESELNRWPQFTTEIDGQIIHFKHIRSARPGARALLLLHDNPGGVMGLLDVLEPSRATSISWCPSCPDSGSPRRWPTPAGPSRVPRPRWPNS
jgi:hypothetical protein